MIHNMPKSKLCIQHLRFIVNAMTYTLTFYSGIYNLILLLIHRETNILSGTNSKRRLTFLMNKCGVKRFKGPPCGTGCHHRLTTGYN